MLNGALCHSLSRCHCIACPIVASAMLKELNTTTEAYAGLLLGIETAESAQPPLHTAFTATCFVLMTAVMAQHTTPAEFSRPRLPGK